MVITPTRNLDVLGDGGSVQSWTWGPMANADTGAPISLVLWADRCVQVTGTFGAGGTIVFEGSNASTYATLNNAQGTAISLTAAGLKQVVELPLLARPNVTAGDGTTSLTCVLVVRRQQPLRV